MDKILSILFYVILSSNNVVKNNDQPFYLVFERKLLRAYNAEEAVHL